MSDMKLTVKSMEAEKCKDSGSFETHKVDANEHMSFWNDGCANGIQLVKKKEEPGLWTRLREGICRACKHGDKGSLMARSSCITTCQLHMRYFRRWRYHYGCSPYRKHFAIKDRLQMRSALWPNHSVRWQACCMYWSGAVDRNTYLRKPAVTLHLMHATWLIGRIFGWLVPMVRPCCSLPQNFSFRILPQEPSTKHRTLKHGGSRWTKKVLATAPTPGFAVPNCPKKFHWKNIARMNRDPISMHSLTTRQISFYSFFYEDPK